MKSLKKIFLGFIALSLFTFQSCKDDNPTPDGETNIHSIRITNAGFAGTGIVAGTMNGTAITFTIPAETNIEAIVFEASLSLGARIDGSTHNFMGSNPAAMTLTGTIRVVNNSSYTDYSVTINLNEPAEEPKPRVDGIVITVNGTDVVIPSANIDNDDLVIYLGVGVDATNVALKELTLRPARTVSNIKAGDKLNNLDVLELDFLGVTNEYTIDFRIPEFTPGIDFSKARVFDFSTADGMPYPTFVDLMTRSADFDGEHVLVVHRTEPRMLRVSDLLQGNANNPIMLNVNPEIVNGGTHVMSAGRLSHGRAYITNLVTSTSETLKVYYYETPTSAPQVVLAFEHDPEITSLPRWGDGISVNLNANGNGYVWFVEQNGGNDMLRFTVRNFTEFSDPTLIKSDLGFLFYGFVNQVAPNVNLVSSVQATSMRLIDNEGDVLFTMGQENHTGSVNAQNGGDVRIFTHNRGRYMIMTTPTFWRNAQPASLVVYDLSEGADLMTAVRNYQDRFVAGELTPAYVYEMTGSPNTSAYAVSTNWAVVNGNLVLFTASTNAGFALIEIPNNE
jgi:hypothetical protein